MNIGKELFIKVTSKDALKNISYKCSVIDKNNDFMYIDQPIQIETKRTLVLSRGTHIKVSFIGKENVMYEYNSIVVHRKMLSIPAYAILPPNTGEIKRIQRRNYVRVQTAIDVAVVKGANDESEPFTTATLDISGGGLACIVPEHIVLEKNELISLYIVLPTKNPVYIKAKARVVQIHLVKMNQLIASMEYLQITPADQQSIIRYVFDIQRKQLERY